MTLKPHAAPDQCEVKVPAVSTKLAASPSTWSRSSNPIPTLDIPPIFRIPAELRLDIYASALLANDSDICLLQTCKQINMEARPILYQRPLTFTTQAHFFDLVQTSDPADLQRIHDVTMHLTDISLSSLIDGSARTTAWALYQQELERIDTTFRSIPGLRRLTLKPPSASHSQLLRGMYLSVLSLIPQRWPSLESLVIEDNGDVLDKVPALRNLRSVHFTVTTGTAPDHRQTRSRSPRVKIEVEDDKPDLPAETTPFEDVGKVDKKAKGKNPQTTPKQARCKRRSTASPATAGKELTAADMVIKARVRKPATQLRPGIAGRRRRGDD